MSKQRKSQSRSRRLWLDVAILLVLAIILLMPDDRLQQWKEQLIPDRAAPAVQEIPETPASPQETDSLTVQVLDAGQADSILITTGDTAILIDGGEYASAAAICDTLRQQGIEKLDAVILTHPHSDHYGGLRSILEKVSVGAFYTVAVPEDQLPTATSYARLIDTLLEQKIPSKYLAAGDELAVGQGSIAVLSPAKGARFDSLNNYSLVLRLTFGSTVFLFTGDAEKQVEEQLLLSGESLAADVLKVGHHGSTTSSSEAFLAAVSPQIAVISAGIDNRYGLPKEKTLTRLQECGATIYRTDLQGCVTVTTNGNEFTVSGAK